MPDIISSPTGPTQRWSWSAGGARPRRTSRINPSTQAHPSDPVPLGYVRGNSERPRTTTGRRLPCTRVAPTGSYPPIAFSCAYELRAGGTDASSWSRDNDGGGKGGDACRRPRARPLLAEKPCSQRCRYEPTRRGGAHCGPCCGPEAANSWRVVRQAADSMCARRARDQLLSCSIAPSRCRPR